MNHHWIRSNAVSILRSTICDERNASRPPRETTLVHGLRLDVPDRHRSLLYPEIDRFITFLEKIEIEIFLLSFFLDLNLYMLTIESLDFIYSFLKIKFIRII